MLIKKIPNTSSLVTATVFNTKISEVDNKIPKYDKYTTTPEFTKVTVGHFKKLKQAYLVIKSNFDKKRTSFNRKITSNKTKYLEIQNELNNPTTNYYNFFLGRMCFTSSDGSQNMFVYQPKLDTLEFKKDKSTDYILSLKSNGVYNYKLKLLYTAFLISIKLSEYKIGTKSKELED